MKLRNGQRDDRRKRARESEIMSDLQDCFLKARIAGSVWWDEDYKWIWEGRGKLGMG